MLKKIWLSGSWDFNPETSEAMVNINWYTLVWEEAWEQYTYGDWIKCSVQNAEKVAENERHLKKKPVDRTKDIFVWLTGKANRLVRSKPNLQLLAKKACILKQLLEKEIINYSATE